MALPFAFPHKAEVPDAWFEPKVDQTGVRRTPIPVRRPCEFGTIHEYACHFVLDMSAEHAHQALLLVCFRQERHIVNRADPKQFPRAEDVLTELRDHELREPPHDTLVPWSGFGKDNGPRIEIACPNCPSALTTSGEALVIVHAEDCPDPRVL